VPTQDRVVSIHPYFKVFDGKIDQFKKLCEQFILATAQEPRCLYYGFSFHGNHVHCREAYEGAEGLLTHLAGVDAILKEALKISEIVRLEVHGKAEELEKLSQPLAALAPTYYALEYGVRRPASADVLSDCIY
jgi:quinol monooxygenase YgiN